MDAPSAPAVAGEVDVDRTRSMRQRDPLLIALSRDGSSAVNGTDFSKY